MDASPLRLGAILCQENRVVAYASRSLSPVEQRYSQTKCEGLAVLFACEHFHLYIYVAPNSLLSLITNPSNTFSRILVHVPMPD